MGSHFNGYHAQSTRNYPLHSCGHGTENWFRGLLRARVPIRLPQVERYTYDELPSAYQARTVAASPSSTSDDDGDCVSGVSIISLTFSQRSALVTCDTDEHELRCIHESVG